MIIKKVEFVISATDWKKCPSPNLPEYAFIGRSNVGKSSLINMLTNHKKLAKVSTSPGKTQTINHFRINDLWFLVDLPGYGYAKVSKKKRELWGGFISEYILKRKNLLVVFVLIDLRHEPQKIDIEFLEQLGQNQIPFSIIFTKQDKLPKEKAERNLKKYKEYLLQTWEELPPVFVTSAISKLGRDEILNYIDEVNKIHSQPK